MWDIAIIGAGLAGLTCARQLMRSQPGLQLCVLDKSRGLGGRMATRRVSDQTRVGQIRVDHGLRYWPADSDGLQSLTEELIAAEVLKQWEVAAYELQESGIVRVETEKPLYAPAAGMSAIAKYLAQDLTPGETLLSQHRAVKLHRKGKGWQIECESGEQVLAARCVVAIPAPQVVHLLLASLSSFSETNADRISPTLTAIKAATYHPCLTVLAGYSPQQFEVAPELREDLDRNSGWMVTDTIGTSTSWACLDSSKRKQTAAPVVVIHSKPDFAARYIDAEDLQPAASVLLRANARKFGGSIAQPEWFQIHRWRYAQVARPCPQTFVEVDESLLCGGDWCAVGETRNIQAAYLSGLAMAERLV